MRTQWLQSARARFAATAAVIFALVVLGGVTATPAMADVNVRITVVDGQSGAALSDQLLQFGPTGTAPSYVLTDASGGFGWGGPGWSDGSYSLVNPNPGIYADPAPLLLDASSSQVTLRLERYKVTGSIPADAGSGLTSVSIQQGNAPFTALGSAAVSSALGDFEIDLPSGPGDYRLVFSPSSSTDYLETVSTSFTVGGSVTIFDLGAVDLNDNPVITGSVTNVADSLPIANATVHTVVGGVELPTVTTDVNGFYRVQPGVGDETYSVWVAATDYFDSGSQIVALNATDGYARNNVDFALDSALVDVTGTIVSDLNPYSVKSTLYKRDSGSGLFEPTPVGTVLDSSSFAFSALQQGDYRLAFTDTATGITLPHAPIFVNGPPENPCYIEFQVDYTVGDLDFSDVAVDADATADICGNPVWAEASDRAITGHVDNYYNFGSQLIAQLWTGGTAMPTLAAVTAVSRTGGDYQFTGIRGAGTYFIKFVPSGNDTFLPTLLGAGGAQEWAENSTTDSAFSTANSFSVDPTVPSSYSDHDVTIEQGVLFVGWLTSYNGSPVDGCVEVIDLDDPTFAVCAQPDSANQWAIRVPVGDTYKFHAVDNVGEYAESWWQNADNETDATEAEASYAGQYVSVNFALAPAPATLYGYVRDVSNTDPITVFLYTYVNGEFIEVASHATTAGSDEVYFDENYFGGYEGLATGDYRVRFQASDGTWLAPTSYDTGRLPERNGTVVTGTDCFVEVPDIAQGRPFYVDATFDAASQDPAACGPEPLDHRKVSGQVISTPAWGPVPVADHRVIFYSDDPQAAPVYSTTAADGTFSATYVPTGTFDIEVSPMAHVLGEHEFTYSGSDFVFDGGNVVLDDPLEATRLGNVTGSISNWDESTMAGATATVYRLVVDPNGNYWQRGPVAQPVDATTGTFEVPGVDVDGDYAVRVDFPSDYAPVFLGGGYPTPVTFLPGFAEQDLVFGSLPVELNELVTISGTVFFGANPLEYSLVVAHPIGNACSCDAFGAYTDADGRYSFQVAPNTDYEIGALSPSQSLLNQTYNGHNYPYDEAGPLAFDPYTVGSVDLAGPDFSLVASDNVFLDSWIGTSDDYDSFTGVDVHIYKHVGEGWEEVATVTSDSAAGAYVEEQGGGDFRFRFSYGGDWLAVNEFYSESSYPFEDDVEQSEAFATPQCSVDIDDVVAGTYVYAEFYLIEDASVGDCAEETLLNVDVTGSTVQSSNVGGGAIEGQTVTLTSTSTNTVYTTSTNASGVFEFEDVAAGDYVLSAPSMTTTNGRIYGAYSTGLTFDSDENLGSIELARFGLVEVQITNFNAATMAGTTAQAYLQVTDSSGTRWEAIGALATVDGTGALSIPAVVIDGVYTVYLNYPAGFVDGYLAGYDEGVVLTGTGFAEYDLTGLDTLAYTTISGTVRLGATWVTGASIVAENLGGDDFTATSGSNGAYTVAVPAGSGYSVEATKTGLVRGPANSVPVGYTPVTGVSSEMRYATFELEMSTLVGAGTTVVVTNVTTHLYRQVAGGWQEVETATTSAPFLWTTLSGSYRMRFSDSTGWLAVAGFGWQNYNDPAEFVAGAYVDPNVCFIDISPVSGGGEYEGEVLTDPASAVECAAEPAVVAPPVTPGTTGTGKPRTAVAPAATTEEAEVAPTSTPTPTPVPSESASAAPGDSDDPDCCAPASAPDLTWLFWVAGILVLFVLAGGAVYLIRRRP